MGLNKPPAFQFYPDNFLGGTAHMTTEEVGAYFLLLCYQWNAGFVPNDDDQIRRIARTSQAFSLVAVKSKFQVGEDGLLRNSRLERERAKQIAFREKQSKIGKMGGRPKGLDNPSLSSGLVKTKAKKRFPSPSPSSDISTRNGASLLAQVFEEWNKLSGLPQCLLVSDKRRRTLECRLSEKYFADNWRSAMDKASKSPFLKGEGESGWKATFDWFITPDSVLKIMEGKYDGNTNSKAGKPNPRNYGIVVGPTNYATAKTKYDRDREAKEAAMARQVATAENNPPPA